MSAQATERLDALREQVRAALAQGDAGALQAAVEQVLAIEVDAATPAAALRALGLGFGALAAELLGEEGKEGAPIGAQSIEHLFNRALRTLEGAPDRQLSDFTVTLNNLATLYDRHGASELRDRVLSQIVQIAEHVEGVIDGPTATVFVGLAQLYRKARQVAPLLTLERQVLRYMLHSRDVSDDTRAIWLGRHGEVLREAQQHDQLEPVFTAALQALQARGDAPHSLAACSVQLARVHESRQDWAAAAGLYDRAAAAEGLPPDDLTAVLSLAGRAWFKAGDFEAASARCERAVRRRVGLEGGAAG